MTMTVRNRCPMVFGVRAMLVVVCGLLIRVEEKGAVLASYAFTWRGERPIQKKTPLETRCVRTTGCIRE